VLEYRMRQEFGFKRVKVTGDREDCIMFFTLCILRQILSDWGA
jgi:hypothetical protein